MLQTGAEMRGARGASRNGEATIMSVGRIEIRRLTTLPTEIRTLVDAGTAEGFSFADRLVRDWESGQNCFDEPGEVFFGAYLDEQLVGFGGLNRDPYLNAPEIGRVRHVYVAPKHRNLGIGTQLIGRILESAPQTFTEIRLRTKDAGSFYERLGFRRAESDTATHVLDMRRSGTDVSPDA